MAWIGPLKAIVQEDQNIIWAALGNKLFRIAPEHARPLSAVEEVQHQPKSTSPEMDTMLEQLKSGNTRFVDLPIAPGYPETFQPSDRSEVERSSEQPDDEPETGVIPGSKDNLDYTPSIAPAEEPTVPSPEPAPEAPENIPVPGDDDEELLSDLGRRPSSEIRYRCHGLRPRSLKKRPQAI